MHNTDGCCKFNNFLKIWILTTRCFHDIIFKINFVGLYIMASQGNNIKRTNQEFRDAFLDTGVGEYIEDRIKYADEELISGVSELSTTHKLLLLRNQFNKKIKKIEDKKLRESVANFVNVALLPGKYNKADVGIIYHFAPEVKIEYCKILMECVEEGMFDEEDMQLVENEIALMLSTIEDLHMVQLKELHPSDTEDEPFM